MQLWLLKKTPHLPQFWHGATGPAFGNGSLSSRRAFLPRRAKPNKAPQFFFLICPTTTFRGHSLLPHFQGCGQKAISSIENSLITLPFLHRFFFFFSSLPRDIRESEVTYIFYSFIKSSPDRVTLLITREQNAWKNPFINVKGGSVCSFQYAESGKIQLSANANLLLC